MTPTRRGLRARQALGSDANAGFLQLLQQAIVVLHRRFCILQMDEVGNVLGMSV